MAKSAAGRYRVQAKAGVAGKGESQPPKKENNREEADRQHVGVFSEKNIANLKLEYSV